MIILFTRSGITKLFTHFRGVGGLDDIARQAGIGEKIELRLGRLDAAGERTSINTESQMELPSIRNQVDKLQGNQT